MIVVAIQFWIIISIEFAGGLAPLLKFFLIMLPILVYTLAVFAFRPFSSSEQDFIDCSTQCLLLLGGFGALLRTEGGNDSNTTDLGTAVVYATLILAVLLIAWALTRDVAHFFGSKQVLKNLNRGESPKLPLLGPFDKGLNGIALFHFAEHASDEGLMTYMKLRAAVSSSKVRLAQREFLDGVQSFVSQENGHSQESKGSSTTTKVKSAEFSRTVRFIQRGGALQILRVLSKLCDEPTYIKTSNWLVFNARPFECMQLCDLILTMLTRTTQGPQATQQAPAMYAARGAKSIRYVSMHACILWPNTCIYTSIYTW